MKDKKGRIIYVGKATNLEGARALVLQPRAATRGFVRAARPHPRRHRDGRSSTTRRRRCSSRTTSSSSTSRASTSSCRRQELPGAAARSQGALSAARGHAPHRQRRRASTSGPITRRPRAAPTLRGGQPPLQAAHLHRSRARTRASARACSTRSSAATRPACTPSPTRSTASRCRTWRCSSRARTTSSCERLSGAHEGRAVGEEYEIAGAVRDQIAALENTLESSAWSRTTCAIRTCSASIARATPSRSSCCTIRNGKLLGRRNFCFKRAGVPDAGDPVVVRVALLRPRHLHPRRGPAAAWRSRTRRSRREWLSREARQRKRRRGAGAAARAAPRSWSSWREKNAAVVVRHAARQGARRRGRRWRSCSSGSSLKRLPQRIECFDISHIQGTATVASMVVFLDGEPAKSEYRTFKVKTRHQRRLRRRCTRCCRAASAAAKTRRDANEASEQRLGGARPAGHRRRQGAARRRWRRCATRRSTSA